VQAALDQLVLGSRGVGRTTIMIAHRLSTVANVDRIVVLRKGKVLESGTPMELTHNGAVQCALQRRGCRVKVFVVTPRWLCACVSVQMRATS
jgi:ABC-type multidrug transport system fused ATPase/permease subunit